ncbi:MAG: hypothetical protein IT483_04435 [Gammaproteobacteria bacterium]|nr:hypothetical protein [Gammaproteobacteria bacterium]
MSKSIFLPPAAPVGDNLHYRAQAMMTTALANHALTFDRVTVEVGYHRVDVHAPGGIADES